MTNSGASDGGAMRGVARAATAYTGGCTRPNDQPIGSITQRRNPIYLLLPS